MTHFGIAADFLGPAGVPGGALAESEWQEIIKAFPRSGFKTGVVQISCGFCKSKPETTYSNFLSDFGESMVEGYNREGRRAYDMIINAVDAD